MKTLTHLAACLGLLSCGVSSCAVGNGSGSGGDQGSVGSKDGSSRVTSASATTSRGSSSASGTSVSTTSNQVGATSSSESNGPSSTAESTSSTSVASAAASTGTGDACHLVQFVMPAHLKVKTDLGPDFDVESPSGCLPPGPLVLEAVCDADGGQDPAVTVNWGNPNCPGGDSICSFFLSAPASFQLTLAGGASCP